MLLYSATFKHIMTIFYTILIETRSVAINNGFSLRFNPVSAKEEVKAKSFGALFAKVNQEVTNHDALLEAIAPQVIDCGEGCTNQIARILPSRPVYENNGSRSSEQMSFLNIPIMEQPFDNYKIIVATAPKHIKIVGGEEAQPLVIYIIFHDDGDDDSKSIKLPTIYFVSKVDGKGGYKRKEKADPIFIIDSNRTVTGLKSTEVNKFIKFRNKLRNHYKYTVVP